MNRLINRIAALAACTLLQHTTVAAPQGEKSVEKIIDRAIGLMAQVEECSIEEEIVHMTSTLDGEGQKSSRQFEYKSFRAPRLLWSEGMQSDGSRTVSLVDGTAMRHLFVGTNGDDYVDGDLTEQPLTPGDYLAVGDKHRFDPQSPLAGDADRMHWAYVGAGPEYQGSRKYLGTRKIQGELCDVIELSVPISAAEWAKVIARYPKVPASAVNSQTFYLRVSDGRLLRFEADNWVIVRDKDIKSGISDSSAKSKEWPDYLNSHHRMTITRRFGTALPADQYTFGRFSAALKGVMGDRELRARPSDEWTGKEMPAFDLVTPEGKPVRWEDFRGKVVVVETWFIGCTYCKHAFPFYEKMRRQLKSQEVVFVAFNDGDEKPQMDKWIDENGRPYGFIWVRSANESGKQVHQKLKIQGDPNFFVLNREGIIAANFGGYGYGNGGEDPRLLAALRQLGIKVDP